MPPVHAHHSEIPAQLRAGIAPTLTAPRPLTPTKETETEKRLRKPSAKAPARQIQRHNRVYTRSLGAGVLFPVPACERGCGWKHCLDMAVQRRLNTSSQNDRCKQFSKSSAYFCVPLWSLRFGLRVSPIGLAAARAALSALQPLNQRSPNYHTWAVPVRFRRQARGGRSSLLGATFSLPW